MVPRWRFLATFLGPEFSASRVPHISDLHSKYTLRPHHVWKYGRHPMCGRGDQWETFWCSTRDRCATFWCCAQVITESLSRQCKCHGVSGSCSMRTCFRSLPFDVRPVAQQLRARYAVAVHVDPRSAARRRRTRSRATAESNARQRRRHTRRDSPTSHRNACQQLVLLSCPS